MGGGSAARKGFHPWTGWVGIILCWTSAAVAGNFVEPPVLASSHGVLDLLMIAQPQPVPSIAYTPPGGSAPINPIGWVYQFCQRAAALPGNVCPPGSATMSPYGGVRWALQQGDTLKLRLVNRLPKQNPVEVDHSSDPGGANLPLNLTNIHTHGLIVPARAATLKDPTFGDYIFVQIYNPANGTPMPLPSHQDGSIVRGFADYRIDIPANHPSGLFWFHPHVHGITLNQVSGGLAGIISIGQAGDYARGDLFGAKFPESQVRYLTLKDMQVLAAGTIQFQNGPANVTAGQVLYQEDPTFCAQYPATPAEVRQGSCPGANNTADEGNNYTGGRWYWSVNGQVYPTINMTSPDGELWRLTNASGSATYDLQLSNDQTQTPMIMQLISVDGVSIDVPPGTAPGTMVTLGGARFKIVAALPRRPPDIHPPPSASANSLCDGRGSVGRRRNVGSVPRRHVLKRVALPVCPMDSALLVKGLERLQKLASRASCRKRPFCSASLTRCTSFKVAAPWVCCNVSNMPPRSMLDSCLSSPAKMSFAPETPRGGRDARQLLRSKSSPPRPRSKPCRGPARPAFLKRVHLAGEGVRLPEAVAAHLLRNVVCPGQAAHVLACRPHRRRASRSGCGSCRFRPRPTAWRSPRPG